MLLDIVLWWPVPGRAVRCTSGCSHEMGQIPILDAFFCIESGEVAQHCADPSEDALAPARHESRRAGLARVGYHNSILDM